MAHNGTTLSKMQDIRKLQYHEYMSDNAGSEQLQLFVEKLLMEIYQTFGKDVT